MADKPRRKRRCPGCRQWFTPKRNASARCCSDRCRNKVWRQAQAKMCAETKVRTQADAVLDARTCLHCGIGFLSDITKHARYCTATCRTRAWKARSRAAIAVLTDYFGMRLSKAEDVLEYAGMRRMSRVFSALGFEYDAQSRCWGVPITEGMFIHQHHP